MTTRQEILDLASAARFCLEVMTPRTGPERLALDLLRSSVEPFRVLLDDEPSQLSQERLAAIVR